jgi:hypothetical protein
MCVSNYINNNVNSVFKLINYDNYIWKYIYFLGWLEKNLTS